MKNFTFRLETLLEMRKHAEEDIERRLAKKNGEITLAQKRVSGVHADLKDLQESEKKRRKEDVGASSDLLSLKSTVSYRHCLKQNLLKEARQLQDLEYESEIIRNELVKAIQKRRSVELLRERRLLEWKKKYRTQEQGYIDDVSQQGFIRKRNAAKVAPNV